MASWAGHRGSSELDGIVGSKGLMVLGWCQEAVENVGREERRREMLCFVFDLLGGCEWVDFWGAAEDKCLLSAGTSAPVRLWVPLATLLERGTW